MVSFLFRRNQQRSIESMQTTLDSESKARQEAVRIKKKMEGDINDLEIQLGHANRQAAEAQKQAKSVQAHVKVSHYKISDKNAMSAAHHLKALFKITTLTLL